MRILFLSSQFPPHELGGYEQWCHEATVGLRDRGHDVQVLTSRYGVRSAKEGNTDGVTRSLYLETDINYYRPLDFFFKRSTQEQANIHELRRLIDEFCPEVVMVWGMWNLSANLPYWAEEWMPGRVSYYVASYWPTDLDPHSAYWRLRARRTATELIKRPLRALAFSQLRREGYPPLLRFEHAVCCSKYVRDELVQAGKLPPSAGVLYGGIDPEPFLRNRVTREKPSKEILRLIYFGRLVPDKGVHTAIEAIGLLKQSGLANRIELTILGDGHPEYKNDLQKMTNRFGISDRVRFAGRVHRDEIPDWLGRFDVFLFTSIWPEPFGRTIVEAMLAGLLVIGSDVGGSREIFEHYDESLLFEAGDARDLADRIVHVTDHPGSHEHLVDVGQRTALERYTLERMVDEIEQYLMNVVKSAPHR